MNELYDYLQQKIGQEDCPIVSIHPVFGIRENYFELVMKDDSTLKITEKQKWETVRTTIGFDKNSQPIIINSWDDKVKRSINNEKESI